MFTSHHHTEFDCRNSRLAIDTGSQFLPVRGWLWKTEGKSSGGKSVLQKQAEAGVERYYTF